MITFIEAKLNKSDDQTNIDKYKVAAYTYYRISYYIKMNFSKVTVKGIIPESLN